MVAGLTAISVAACGGSEAPAPGAATGGGGDTLAQLKDKGSVTVAVISNPPFSDVKSDGSMEGIAPALATEVFTRLGVDKAAPVTATYGNAVPGLKASRWDVIASALDVTPERCKEVIFSDPITFSPFVFLVPKGNPDGITSVKDAVDKGLKLAQIQGGIAVDIVTKAGLSPSKVSTYPNIAARSKALLAGRADYTISTIDSAQAGLDLMEGKWEKTEPIQDAPANVQAFAFRSGDTALRDAVNTELENLRSEGKYAEIANRWGFDPTLIEGKSTQVGCEGGNQFG